MHGEVVRLALLLTVLAAVPAIVWTAPIRDPYTGECRPSSDRAGGNGRRGLTDHCERCRDPIVCEQSNTRWSSASWATCSATSPASTTSRPPSGRSATACSPPRLTPHSKTCSNGCNADNTCGRAAPASGPTSHRTSIGCGSSSGCGGSQYEVIHHTRLDLRSLRPVPSKVHTRALNHMSPRKLHKKEQYG